MNQNHFDELLFLIPMLVALGVLALGFKVQTPQGEYCNRATLGVSLIAAAILFWLSSMLLLVYRSKFYFLFDTVMVFFFFGGLALFFPPPFKAARIDQHRLAGSILIWIGVVLGLAHSMALLFTTTWPTQLLEFYAALGLHGPPPVDP